MIDIVTQSKQYRVQINLWRALTQCAESVRFAHYLLCDVFKLISLSRLSKLEYVVSDAKLVQQQHINKTIDID